MRRPFAVGSIAALLYVVAWFLPVAEGASTLDAGVLPGWEALRVALSPLWPYERFIAEGSLRASLAVASGVTNLLFVAACWALLQARSSGRSVNWIAFPLLIAAVINATWLWSSPAELSWGYYCWLASFILLALAADRTSGATDPAVAPAPEAVEQTPV
jgi:hypothetical protein